MEPLTLTHCATCERVLKAPCGPEAPLRPFESPLCEIWFYQELCGGLDRIMERDTYGEDGKALRPISGVAHRDKAGGMVYLPRLTLKTSEGEILIRLVKRNEEETQALEHILKRICEEVGDPHYFSQWGR